MTAPTSIDPARFLHEQLDQASPDLTRDLLSTFIDALLSAEADAVCGADWGQVSPERVNQRNGYRHRDLDTRVGTIDIAVPKLRTGSYWVVKSQRGPGVDASVLAWAVLVATKSWPAPVTVTMPVPSMRSASPMASV